MLMEQRAKELFENLLREVPEEERKEFRRRAHSEAEKIATFKEMTSLEEEPLIIGYILATPPQLKSNLRKILSYNGVDPSPYENYL